MASFSRGVYFSVFAIRSPMAPRGSSRHTMTPRHHPRVARPARDVSSTVTRRCDRQGTTHLRSRKNGLDCLRVQKSMARGCHCARSGRTRLGVFKNVLVGVLFFNPEFRESLQKSRKSVLQTVIVMYWALTHVEEGVWDVGRRLPATGSLDVVLRPPASRGSLHASSPD